MAVVKNPSSTQLAGFYSLEYKRRFDVEKGKTMTIPDDIVWRALANGLEVVKIAENAVQGNVDQLQAVLKQPAIDATTANVLQKSIEQVKSAPTTKAIKKK